MKTIAVLEYVAGGGFAQSDWSTIPLSLRREGTAMLEAIVEELSFSNRFQVVACRDARSLVPESGASSACSRTSYELVQAGEDFRRTWLRLAQSADATIVIAPETDDILTDLCHWLRSHQIRVLCSDDSFLRTTSDKFETAKALFEHGVLHPRTIRLDQWHDHSDAIIGNQGDSKTRLSSAMRTDGFVVKSRDGAGCEVIHRLRDAESVSAFADASADAWRWIVQPWHVGQSGSIAVLCGPADRLVLPACTQSIQADDQVRYLGGEVPWRQIAPAQADSFAGKTIQALQGTPIGWVGIDFLVLADGTWMAIEVNPRVTTSILGLRQLYDGKLMEAMISLALGSSYGLVGNGKDAAWSAD
jgi:predicted ATP-grasp superfamily ATP-dependent carboligase